MKTARLLACVVVLLVATAYASPLMGVWKGELNGKPITITLNVVNRRLDGRFAVSGSPQTVQINNTKFTNNMNVLRFQVPNQTGPVKLISSGPEQLSFELELTGTDQAVLHSLDDSSAPGIKMSRTAKADQR